MWWEDVGMQCNKAGMPFFLLFPDFLLFDKFSVNLKNMFLSFKSLF